MVRTIKYILISMGVIVAVIFGFYVITLLSFSGAFDKKYTRKELTDDLIEHEEEYADLYAYFIKEVAKDTTYIISSGSGNGNSVNITLYPQIIDPANKIIGGDNLVINSPKLDSVLTVPGWTNKTVFDLRDKLSKTKCDWISTRDGNDSTVELYPNQSGWGSYSFVILNKPANDTIIKYMGRPVSNSAFGRQVELVYRTAL